jgi:hypothetical protein
MSNKMKITSNDVTGGPDGADLIGCYFLPTNENDKYIFFNADDTPIVTNPMPVFSGHHFTFSLEDDDNWKITNFKITEASSLPHASGHWTNYHHNKPPDDDDDQGDGESGTFQAQAGSTPPDPERAASAAKA